MGKIEELRERRAKIYLGGGVKAIEKQHARGKLSARERIDALLDPRYVRGAGHLCQAPLPCSGDGEQGDSG